MSEQCPALEEQCLEDLSGHRRGLYTMAAEEANLSSHPSQPEGLQHCAVLFDLGVVMAGHSDAVDFVSEFMQSLGE
jgi:hypothetical protein